MFHFFEKVNKGQINMVNAILLKMAKSYTIVILVKSSKGLELVSILQHRAKNVIEIFIIQHTII